MIINYGILKLETQFVEGSLTFSLVICIVRSSGTEVKTESKAMIANTDLVINL
jgi:hypothetical protein